MIPARGSLHLRYRECCIIGTMRKHDESIWCRALDLFERLVRAIERHLRPKTPRATLDFVVSSPVSKNTEPVMLTLKITNEQQITVSVTPKTPAGKPATVEGKPAWTQQSGNASLTIADDGLSATLISADQPGESQFLISADADLGEGVELIQDVITLIVESAKAASLGLTAGEPTPKPV